MDKDRGSKNSYKQDQMIKKLEKSFKNLTPEFRQTIKKNIKKGTQPDMFPIWWTFPFRGADAKKIDRPLSFITDLYMLGATMGEMVYKLQFYQKINGVLVSMSPIFYLLKLSLFRPS